MKAEETFQWLMENGGPVIRYRTATELLQEDKKLANQTLQNDMLQSPQVQKWLKCILPPLLLLNEPLDRTPRVWESGTIEIHGNKPTNFENSIGKLTDFGLKKGIAEFDRRTLPYKKWLKENAEQPIKNVYSKYNVSMIASFLALAGYVDEPCVAYVLKNRLEKVYNFTCKGNYDIFIDGENKGVKPIIKPEITPGGEAYLPMIYDIVGWGAYLQECGTKVEKAKADKIIEYIMTKEYQAFPPGYGYMKDESSGRSWSLGWNIQIPGYASSRCSYKSIVHTFYLLINFSAAREHPWFKEILAQFNEYQTGDGTYLFPREYLPEEKIGYWVCGSHMGMEENRRINKAIEAESTFWMAKFNKTLMTAED